MTAALKPLTAAKTLSVMPTYQCTANCRHCGTYSSPRAKERLDRKLMFSAIDQAIDAGYKVVVFTGGEPTLEWDQLLAGIGQASSRHTCTRVVSNASWATDQNEADRVIDTLVAAGLREVNFSTGDQHSKFVPLDNILRAVRAAARQGMRTIAIMVETVSQRTVTKDHILSHPEFRRIREDYPRVLIRVMESPWMSLTPKKVLDYPKGMTTEVENLPFHTGCTSCLGTTTLQADGVIAACCGLGMRSIKELQLGHIATTTIAEADELAQTDFLKRWIRAEGPGQILSWAAAKDPSIQWEGMYAHRCQICMRLYRDPAVGKVIRDHHQEKMADVLFREWLIYHFDMTAPTAADADMGVVPQAA